MFRILSDRQRNSRRYTRSIAKRRREPMSGCSRNATPLTGGNSACRGGETLAKLRRKLDDDARKPRYVIGVRSLGYRMPEPDRA